MAAAVLTTCKTSPQRRGRFETGAPGARHVNETWPKSGFVGDVIKLVMNPLTAQWNYSLQTGAQDV